MGKRDATELLLEDLADRGVHLDDLGVQGLFGTFIRFALLFDLLHDEIGEVALFSVVGSEEELQCCLSVIPNQLDYVILLANLVIFDEVFHFTLIGAEVFHVIFVFHFRHLEVEVCLIVRTFIHIDVFNFHLHVTLGMKTNLLIVSHIQNLARQISGNVCVVLLFFLFLSFCLLVRFVIIIDLVFSILHNYALASREAPIFVFFFSNAP